MYAILCLLNLFQPCHDAARDVCRVAAELHHLTRPFLVRNEGGLEQAKDDLRDGKTKWIDGTDLKDKIAVFESERDSWCMTRYILNRVTAVLDTAFPPPAKAKD
jgi:hypothetical protein